MEEELKWLLSADMQFDSRQAACRKKRYNVLLRRKAELRVGFQEARLRKLSKGHSIFSSDDYKWLF